MTGNFPQDREEVEVRLDDRAWLTAVYRNGEFVDTYGLPLDSNRITSWRPLASGANDGTTH